MGYYIFSSGIDTNKIKSVFGSKDQNLLNDIKTTDTFKNYNSDSFNPLSVETALEQLINGDTLDEKQGYVYGYAVISICNFLGEELPYANEIKFGYETEFIDQYLVNDFEIDDTEIEQVLLESNPAPFEIPSIQDWPMINVLYHTDLIELKERFASIAIANEMIEALEEEDEEEEKLCSYEHIQGIISNINYCIENNLDMINFCH